MPLLDYRNCLEDYEIEGYVRQIDDEALKRRCSTHISHCFRCFNRYFEIRMLDEILDTELQKPISDVVRNWVREM